MIKKHILFLVTLLVGVIFAGAALAEIYKWVDENGVVHLSDSPPQEIISTGKAELIPTYAPDPPAIQPSQKPTPKTKPKTKTGPPTQQITSKPKTPKVELYTTAWCVYCRKAREFFRSRGISFVEYDIEKDEDAARRKNKLTDGRGVPFAVINGQGIYGYDEGAYIRALKGYL